MLLNIYWNKNNGSVIVPTVAQTEAGYWLDVEPVECASWSNVQGVQEAVRKAASRSGQIVSTPSRQSFPKPVVLVHSSAKSLKAFESQYEMASIVQSDDGSFSIERYQDAPDGTGRVVDSDASMTYPAEVSLDQLVVILSDTIDMKTKGK